jgi:hypothetical protein
LSSVELLPFFRGIYGEPVPGQERYMCIAFLRPGGKMIERFFRWDDEIDTAIGMIERMIETHRTTGQGVDMYYCVSLLTARRRTKDFLDKTLVVWSDLDDTPPNKLRAEPTYLIETSLGHYQAVWALTEPVPYEVAEDFARRVYLAHRKDGADSTWDATRLMRVPGTNNMKYVVQGISPEVRMVSQTGLAYELDELDEAYPVTVNTGPGSSAIFELDYSQLDEVGSLAEIMDRYGREISPDIHDLVYGLADPADDWSAKLWLLEMSLFELGMDIYEVFMVVSESGCNKYARDGRPDADLWKEVVRARDTVERKAGMVLTTQEIEEIDLLDPEEILAVQKQPPAFIERYQEWASSRTDAPREFHVGGALMALSAGLSDRVEAETAFGDVKPNIWVMLVSDSTISRKTTSMSLAMEISEGAGVDSLLATDGSMEGLLTELEAREGMTSMFLRDEFTSLIEAAKKKDYMGGFLSDLCGLYDGRRTKRRLRKEVITVKRPVFLLFAGGVETKLLELLGHEDITSGFIPRFLPIFGRTSVSDLDLIGKRKHRSFAEKDALIAELREIIDMYTPVKPLLRVPNGQQQTLTPQPLGVDMSDEAWDRLRVAQKYLLEMADSHDSRDLLLPCTERLVVNVLKVSILIAASRKRPVREGNMTVEMDDLMLSLYFARGWLDHLLRIVTKVGRDPFDGRTHQILEFITYGGERGTSRANLMRHFRSNKREMDEIIDTLLDREEIVSEGGTGPTGRGAIYRATQHARTAKQIRVTAPVQMRRNNPATRS